MDHIDPSEALYEAVSAAFDLDEHELALLTEACRTVALCAALQDQLDADGLMVTGPAGASKVHPAAAELRQQRITLARLLVALRIPTNDDGEVTDEPRPQRRPLRGVYGIGEAS